MLEVYAAALKRIHGLVPRLSITALRHWSRADYLKVLEPNVDELLPMRYDFEAEPILKNQSPLPLISPENFETNREIGALAENRGVRDCPFLHDQAFTIQIKKLRGQICNWNWDELCFSRSFQPVNGAQFGTRVLRAATPTSIANTALVANFDADNGAISK